MILRSASAALLALSTLASAPAFAGPPAPSVSSDDGLVIQVRGCHRDPQRHYVPEFDDSVWHVHRGGRCRPVEVDRPRRDDDDYGPGGRRDDCHRDVRRHPIRGVGNVYHRHRGPSCRIEIFEDRGRARPGAGACENVGGATLCLRD